MMEPNQIVGERFQIERLVARGGMGAVYRARDLHTDALAALKTVGQADAHSLERFAREARLLADLHHPGIVKYLAHGRTAEGDLYLAMEWLDGEDLAARLESRPPSPRESLRVVAQVAAALAVAHARRIVHRDLKPSNLFLSDFDIARVKVLDFGVARLAQQEGPTATGVVVGTPQYMSPEQARGLGTVDARADVFALGAVLHRLLTGRLPFPGRTLGEVLAQVIHADPPRVRELRPELPAALDELVARMLQKDPEARPRDAGAVLVELMNFDGLGTPRAGEITSAPTLRVGEVTDEELRAECVILADAAPDAELARLAAAHGGQLEQADGASLITLASQRVATDQARSAARCALALHRERPGTAMALTIRRRRVTVTGPAIVPAELARLVPHGGIRLDANLAGLLDARFVVVGDAHGLLLQGELTVDDEARTLLGQTTPFVGRDQELGMLTAIFDSCAREGEAKVVLVTAPPGMGKSRLRQELSRRLPVEVWVGRGDPMRAGAPFSLLGEAVRRAAGITGDEPLEERRRLLAARVARHTPSARSAVITEFIGEMAGVPFPAESLALKTARRDPRLLGDQMRAAFQEWLEAECAHAPVVIVLEDLHWGDAPTVKFIDAALQALAERPFMVLALARPEVKEQFPDLWLERGIQSLSLAQLSRRAAERLVRQALPQAGGETVARIVERAAGNAFYLEELVRHVAAGSEGTLPDTVLAMVEARLQALPAEARRVLRAGSVFGEVFWRGAVRALTGGSDPEASLDELTRREVIRRHERARFPGEDEYGFRHGLIRDAAYATLTESDRTVGHRLAGEWLEGAGEGDALALAEHFQRGEERPRAVTAYLRAAEQALAGNDMAATIARAERGVTCGAAGEDLGRLRLSQAEAHAWIGDNAAAAEYGLLSLASLPRGSSWWFIALGETVAGAGRAVQGDTVLRLLGELRREGTVTTQAHAIAFARVAIQAVFYLPSAEARELVPQLRAARERFADDLRVVAWLEQALATYLVVGVTIEECLQLHGRCIETYTRVGDLRNACLERAILGAYLVTTGSFAEAQPGARATIALADAMGLKVPGLLARTVLGISQLYLGELDDAAASAADVVARVPELGSSPASVYALCFAARVTRRLGQPELAAERAREVLEKMRSELGMPGFLARLAGYCVTEAVRLLVDGGHPEEAAAVLDRVFPVDDDHTFAGAAYGARAHVRRALGDTAAADRDLATAWALVLRQAEDISDPARRARFLDSSTGAPELRDEVRRFLGR